MLAMARVVKPVTGRAVVLTYDKTSMFKVGCVAALFPNRKVNSID